MFYILESRSLQRHVFEKTSDTKCITKQVKHFSETCKANYSCVHKHLKGNLHLCLRALESLTNRSRPFKPHGLGTCTPKVKLWTIFILGRTDYLHTFKHYARCTFRMSLLQAQTSYTIYLPLPLYLY